MSAGDEGDSPPLSRKAKGAGQNIDAETDRPTEPSAQLAKRFVNLSKSSELAKQFAHISKLTGPSSEFAKQYANLSKSSELAKQFAHISKLTGPSSEFAKQYANLSKSSELAKQFADISKLTRPNSEFAKQYANLSKSSELAKQFADISKLTGPNSEFAKQYANFSKLASSAPKQFAELAKIAQSTASLITRYDAQLQKLTHPDETIQRYEDRLDGLVNVASRISSGHVTPSELATFVGSIDQFPHSIVVEQIFAEEIVATAANENKLGEVAGASLAIDTAAAERLIETKGSAGLPTLLDRIAAALTFHFERAKNLAELFHLYNTATLVVATLALWYAMDSATSEDVKAAATETKNQSEIIKEEGNASRELISRKFDELLRGINEHAARKSSTFSPAKTYVVKRAIPVKAERRLKSATVGILQIGQAVFSLSAQRKWLYIEGTNALTGEQVSGWVVKKYLQRLQ